MKNYFNLDWSILHGSAALPGSRMVETLLMIPVGEAFALPTKYYFLANSILISRRDRPYSSGCMLSLSISLDRLDWKLA